MEEYGEEGPRRSLAWEGLAIGAGCLFVACLAPAPLLAILCGGFGVASLLIAATTRPEERSRELPEALPPDAPIEPLEAAACDAYPDLPPATRWADRTATAGLGPRAR